MKIGASLEAITGRPSLADDLRDPTKALTQIFSAVVRTVTEYHLQAVELPMDAAVMYPSLFTRDVLLQVRRLSQENSFFFTVHLPHVGIDLSSPDEEVRQAGVKRVLEAVDMVEPLEPQAYVLHLVGERAEEREGIFREVAAQTVPQPTLNAAACSLEEIARKVEPLKLCVENLRGAPFFPQVPMAKAFGASLCVDVGHFLVQGIDPLPFIEGHWDMVREIHFHDVIAHEKEGNPTLDDHRPLGTGLLDTEGFLKTLKGKDYQGILVVEVFKREYLPPSMAMLDRILPRTSN